MLNMSTLSELDALFNKVIGFSDTQMAIKEAYPERYASHKNYQLKDLYEDFVGSSFDAQDVKALDTLKDIN